MASISDLRSGIATNLATISGLRVSATIPDQINPPIAIVELQSIDYDRSMHRANNIYTFRIVVLVARVSERSGQNKLDAYVASTGSSSIKTAMETDRTLGGAAHDSHLTQLSSYGVTAIGEVDYMSAEFQLLVHAS